MNRHFRFFQMGRFLLRISPSRQFSPIRRHWLASPRQAADARRRRQRSALRRSRYAWLLIDYPFDYRRLHAWLFMLFAPRFHYVSATFVRSLIIFAEMLMFAEYFRLLSLITAAR